MLKRLALTFGICGLLAAQTPTLTTNIVPTGPWPLCEPNGVFAGSFGNPFCMGFIPGVSETYFLLIGGATPNVVGYQYVVTATVDGKTMTAAGIVARWDSTTGWPAPNVSMIIMAFGGVASNFQVIELQPVLKQGS